MMKDIKNKLLCLLMMFVSTTSVAVQLNHKGLGEVLIYPYYTVNNSLNTLYSVVNTTSDTKAIRVRFLEGDIGMDVLSFNIYLSAFDVWTGGLIPGTSTLTGHIGEPSVIHVTSDTSCAPFLTKSGQEFLPFNIDLDIDADNHSLKRATEGHIEMIELATFSGGTIAGADHGTTGSPPGCRAIQNDWSDNGMYDNFADEQAPTGGLFGSATLVNVAEGIAFPYDAIALQNFWQGDIIHTEPGSLEPNLSSAYPQSTAMLDSGELAISEWTHGYQAVSAVLTKAQLINEFAFDTVLDGKTEWVITFPTKKFHTNNNAVLAPFSQIWNGSNACDRYNLEQWDREENYSSGGIIGGDPRPIGGIEYPRMCKTSNVLEFIPLGETVLEQSKILGSHSQNHVFVGVSGEVTENGWGRLDFLDAIASLPSSGPSLKGFPAAGFSVLQFTNAGSADGLLAQYGSLFKHKAVVKVDD